MFNDYWINAWHFLVRLGKNIARLFKQICVDSNLLGGEIHSNEEIIHNTRSSRDIYRYNFDDIFHITLNIKCVRSQRISRTRSVSSHSQHEFTCLYSSQLWEKIRSVMEIILGSVWTSQCLKNHLI
jgi:hypothetical protein